MRAWELLPGAARLQLSQRTVLLSRGDDLSRWSLLPELPSGLQSMLRARRKRDVLSGKHRLRRRQMLPSTAGVQSSDGRGFLLPAGVGLRQRDLHSEMSPGSGDLRQRCRGLHLLSSGDDLPRGRDLLPRRSGVRWPQRRPHMLSCRDELCRRAVPGVSNGPRLRGSRLHGADLLPRGLGLREGGLLQQGAGLRNGGDRSGLLRSRNGLRQRDVLPGEAVVPDAAGAVVLLPERDHLRQRRLLQRCTVVPHGHGGAGLLRSWVHLHAAGVPTRLRLRSAGDSTPLHAARAREAGGSRRE